MDFFAFASQNARAEFKSTYKCWNCGETAEHGKPHACDTTRDDFARIRRTRSCYRCGAPPEHCECPDAYEQ